MSIDAGAQVAIILLAFGPVWSLLIIETGCIWVELPVQRRLCKIFMNGVGLPDLH